MRKTIIFGIIVLVAGALAACGGGGDTTKPVTAFMDKVKAGQLDAAVGLIRNQLDKQVPANVKKYFEGKTVAGYTLLQDKDSKSGAAADMGMAVAQVTVRFADGEKTIRFMLRKDGDWAISNVLFD